MKKTLKDYIKIVMTIFIIAGMFIPYFNGILPIEVLIENTDELEVILALTVPLMVTVPFLLILIFKDVLKESVLSVLKNLFLIVYVIILGNFGYEFYYTYSDESLEFLISIIASLILFILSLKYATTKMEKLQNIFLAIITLPTVFYFINLLKYDLENFNYGAYLISISFLILYIIAIQEISKNRYHQKQLNHPN